MKSCGREISRYIFIFLVALTAGGCDDDHLVEVELESVQEVSSGASEPEVTEPGHAEPPITGTDESVPRIHAETGERPAQAAHDVVFGDSSIHYYGDMYATVRAWEAEGQYSFSVALSLVYAPHAAGTYCTFYEETASVLFAGGTVPCGAEVGLEYYESEQSFAEGNKVLRPITSMHSLTLQGGEVTVLIDLGEDVMGVATAPASFVSVSGPFTVACVTGESPEDGPVANLLEDRRWESLPCSNAAQALGIPSELRR